MEVCSPIGACSATRCQAPILLKRYTKLQSEIKRMKLSLQTISDLLENQQSATAATISFYCLEGLGTRTKTVLRKER